MAVPSFTTLEEKEKEEEEDLDTDVKEERLAGGTVKPIKGVEAVLPFR